LLPEGWTKRPLGELIQPDRKITYGIVQPGGFVEEGVPLVRGGDYANGWVPLTAIKRVRPEIDAPYRRSKLRGGDLLMTIVGYTGTVAEVPEWLAGANITQTTARIAIDENVSEPRYCFHALQSSFVQDQVKRFTKGAAQPGLNLEDIELLVVPCPPRVEQRRIAAVLDSWDQAVDTAERLIARKRTRFRWTREVVLAGRARLAGRWGEWRRVRLGQVLHEHGATSTGAEPVYSVSVHRGLVDQIEHLGRSFAAATTSHYNRVMPGDIVYTKSPTGDFPLGIIKQSKVESNVIVSPLYGVFTPESRVIGVLLDAYFSSPGNTMHYLAPLVQKGAKNTIAVTNNQFLQGFVELPSDPGEVQALSDLVEAALDDISVTEKEIALLRRQKRGLMQKLLTGEWRVTPRGNDIAPGAADRLSEAAE
jgi:type I restriction enzyme S subunit